MFLRLTGDRVLVRRDEREEWAGSIYLPDACRDKGRTGKVVAKGPKAASVNIGDVIYAPLFAESCDIKINGLPYWLIRHETDIYGVLDR